MPDHNLSKREREAGTADRAPRRARRRLLVLLALVAFAIGGAWVFRDRIAALLPARTEAPAATTATAEPPPALTVAVAEARPRPLAHVVTGDGSVVAWQELVIGAEPGGLRVAEVLVEEGDTVRAGQLLVRLDDALLRAAHGQAEAAVA